MESESNLELYNIMEVYNTSEPQSDSDDVASSPAKIFTLVVFCVIFVFGTIGNGLVVYVTGFRMRKSVNSIWFLNLAIADFLFTGFLIFQIINVSRDYNWPFGDIMCKLSSLVTGINMFASIFLLMAISFDRCLCTWVVVWAQNKRTPLKAQLACVVTWLAALACSIPNAIVRYVEKYDDGTHACVKDTSMEKSLILFHFVFGFVIPFLIITISYIAIGMRARRLHKGKNRKSLRIIIAIILTFFICWLPFHLLSILYANITDRNIAYILITMSVNLAFLNSCLNPILYMFMCDEFHKKIQQSLCFVLESALAEDRHSFATTHSLSSHLSRISRKSDSSVPIEKKDASTSNSNHEELLMDNVNTRDPQREMKNTKTT